MDENLIKLIIAGGALVVGWVLYKVARHYYDQIAEKARQWLEAHRGTVDRIRIRLDDIRCQVKNLCDRVSVRLYGEKGRSAPVVISEETVSLKFAEKLCEVAKERGEVLVCAA